MLNIGQYEFVLIPLFTIIVTGISFFLFYWFNASDHKQIKENQNSVQNNNKKKKKKHATLKSEKNNDNAEKKKHSKHIEIKESPELIEDFIRPFEEISIDAEASKPILKNADDSIINLDDGFQECVWEKIPKDELEILRSRHSSVVSDSRDTNDAKLTKKQKKRLKAKLKALEVRRNKQIDQENNSAVFTDVVDEDLPMGDFEIEKSYETMEKCNELAEFQDVKYSDNEYESNSFEDKSNFLKGQQNSEELSKLKVTLDQRNEEIRKLEVEIENLKRNSEQKLNEMERIRSALVNYEKENKILEHKNNELDRSMASLKNEYTKYVQKNNNVETRLTRLNADHEQQINFFENNIESLNCIIEENNHVIRSLNQEMNSYKDQISKKHQDMQELDKENRTLSSNLKEKESLIKQLEDKLKQQYVINGQLKNEHEKLKQSHNMTITETKKKQSQHDALVSSLQYQIDDLQRERQDFIDFDETKDLNRENEKFKSYCKNSSIETNGTNPSSTIIPAGYDLIEIEKLKQFTQIINAANDNLRNKCEQYDKLIIKSRENEKELLNENMDLKQKSKEQSSKLKNYMGEFYTIKSSIEEFKKISLNSQKNTKHLKKELLQKDEALNRIEQILIELETSIDNEEQKYLFHIKRLEEENDTLRSNCNDLS